MKLTDEELKWIPSHYCEDCGTAFGYDHDAVHVEDVASESEGEDEDELELICCPDCGKDDTVSLVADRDDHMEVVWAYICQLEVKDRKRGSGDPFTPYPWDSLA